MTNQLDGLKTFEEDIGDIAGLKASFKAYNNHVKQNENQIDDSIKLLPIFPQYSDKQLFFLSYAQVSNRSTNLMTM
jgi:predicted metalloendopeptidase